MQRWSLVLVLAVLADCGATPIAKPNHDEVEAPARAAAGVHAWRTGEVKTAIAELEAAHTHDPRALAVLARAWLHVGNGDKARAAGAAALAAAGATATPRFVADLGDGVERVAASSDGVLVATTPPSHPGRKPATTIWDTTIGRDLYRLADTQVAAFGGNGTLATGDSSGLVAVRDAATGRLIRELAPRIGAPVWIAFADNTIIAIDGASIHEWDAASGRELRTYAAPKGFHPDKSAFALSADGTLLVGAIRTSLATGDACAIWSRRDAAPKATLIPLGAWVVGGVAIAHDGRIAIGVRARPLTKIVLVDAPHAKLVGELATADEARVLGFRPDGDLVAVGHALQRWHAGGDKPVQNVALPSEVGRGRGVLVAEATVLVAANESVALIAASGDEAGKAWAVAGRAEAVRALSWSPDGTRLAMGGASPRVTVWDVVRGGRPATYDANEPVSAIAIDRDGRVAASLHRADSRVIVWSAAGARERELEARELGSLAFDGGGLVGRELEDPRVVHAWSASGAPIDVNAQAVPGRTFAVSPDRTQIAEASDQRIIIRAAGAGGKVVGIVQVGDAPTAIAWGATALATAHPDGRISCYNHTTGDAERTLSAPNSTSVVTALAFRPDGHTLAVGRLDGVVELWDMPSQTRIAQLAPSRDNHWLVLASDGSADGEPGVASTLTWEAGGVTLPWVSAWDRHVKAGLLAAVVAKPPPAIAVTPVRQPVDPAPRCLPRDVGPIVSATPSADGGLVATCWLREPDQHAMCFDVDLAAGLITPVPPDLETQDAASHWAQADHEPTTSSVTWDDDHAEAKVCALDGSACHAFPGRDVAVTSDHALVAVRVDAKVVEIWDRASGKRLARHVIPVRSDAHSAIGFWSHTLLVSAEACVGPCETSIAYDTRTGRRLGAVGGAAHPANTSEFAPVLLHDDVWAFHEELGGGAIVIQDATTAQVIARVTAKELGVDPKDLRGPTYELRAAHDGGVLAIGAGAIAGRVWTLDRRGAVTHGWRVPTCTAN